MPQNCCAVAHGRFKWVNVCVCLWDQYRRVVAAELSLSCAVGRAVVVLCAQTHRVAGCAVVGSRLLRTAPHTEHLQTLRELTFMICFHYFARVFCSCFWLHVKTETCARIIRLHECELVIASHTSSWFALSVQSVHMFRHRIACGRVSCCRRMSKWWNMPPAPSCRNRTPTPPSLRGHILAFVARARRGNDAHHDGHSKKRT